MGVGHVAVALGASRAASRMNVGWLVFAAFLSDFLLGIFASLGLEHAYTPENYANRHYLLFDFPYSHGLLPVILWATLFGFLISRAYKSQDKRIWFVVGVVVLSHFVLDGLVHVAGLPIIGRDSPKFGLGLWNHMPLELSLETLMALIGVAIYWRAGESTNSRLSRYGMALFVVLVTAMTWSQLSLKTPPPERQLQISWILVPIIFAAIPYALDSRRIRRLATVGPGGS
jgi:membrane-bound metal-dependent hydrolase YbcI (DUF457 family)